MQAQLSFDGLFQSNECRLSAGDIVSMIYKDTLQHEFRTVTWAGSDSIRTVLRGACQINNPHTVHDGILARPDYLSGRTTIFENDEVIIGKTTEQKLETVIVRSGLLIDFSRKYALESLARNEEQKNKPKRRGKSR